MKFLPFFLLIICFARPVSGQRPSLKQPLRSTGDGLKGEYFKGNAFQDKQATRIDPVINFTYDAFSRTESYLKLRPFTVRWTGLLLAPVTGQYRFTSDVDDGLRITLGGLRVLDEWRYRKQLVVGRPFRMEAGKYYDIVIEYHNEAGYGYVDLDWEFREKARYTTAGFTATRPIIPGRFLFSAADPTTPPPVKTPPATQTPLIAGREAPKANIPSKTNSAAPQSAKLQQAGPREAQPRQSEPVMALSSGSTVILRNVTFEQGEYILQSASFNELNQLAASLKSHPGIRVEIAGHTDLEGDQRLNQYLSENRAKVVANYLVRKGINEEQITIKGYGGKRPLVNSGTVTERAVNRRVEITVTSM